MTPEFWRGKRVLVTGHTGFKGAWLGLWLNRLEAETVGLSLAPPTEPNLFSAARLGEQMDSVIADIRDRKAVLQLVRDFRPEMVFHLAAQSLVRTSYEMPFESYEINVMGTASLLEAVRKHPGVRAVLVITSDKCYENREWIWGYRESEPLGGKDPYSSSKACAELVVAAYRQSFFQPSSTEGRTAVATARGGNVVGGGDWASDRLVPDLVRAFQAGRPAQVRNPGSVRPWQHVLDLLNGYFLLVERMWDSAVYSEAWNFGPYERDARPVSWLADKAAGIWKDGAQWSHDASRHPPEATLLKLDASKARARLGWEPRFDVDTALDWTIRWYRDFYREGADARSLCLNNISKFEGDLIDDR